MKIKWTKDDVKGGWFSAEVQDFDIANDWIKVEYSSEKGHIYKVEVSTYLNQGLILLKNPDFGVA